MRVSPSLRLSGRWGASQFCQSKFNQIKDQIKLFAKQSVCNPEDLYFLIIF